MRPGGDGISRSSASAVMLLPQPDSPTTHSVSPRADLEVDAVEHQRLAAARPELDAQVLDAQQGGVVLISVPSASG